MVALLVISTLVLVVPVSAGTGTWTSNGPFATGLGNQTIYALALSPNGSVIYCGTGSGSVFSFTFVTIPPITTPTTAPGTTTTTAPVTTTTTAPATSVTTATTSASGTGADDSGDTGRDTSFAVTAPGTPAGGTMTFAVNEPLSAGSTDYAYAIISVSLVPSGTLGSTDLIVTDAGTTSHAPDDRTIAGIVAISPVAVNPSSISSGTITFAVSKSWLTEHGLTPADIVLIRYHDGVWAELPTTYQDEAGNAYYFTATTPGFSYFAIAARTGMASVNATVTGQAVASVPFSTTQAVIVTSPIPASVEAASAGTSAPVTIATTAAPVSSGGSSGIPVLSILTGIGGIAVVAVGVMLVRRWWIRRQNPALFRNYD
jgi:PGF-pre-PGF domain-containing protein